MRMIDNAALATMTSPVKKIFEKLHIAIVRIAPEREEELDRNFPEFTLEYVDSHSWILDVYEDKKIRISTFVLEFLWVTAYAHFVFYTRVFQGKKFSSRTEVDLGDDPHVAEAMTLLKWAVEKLVNRDDSQWPDGMPAPKMIKGDTSDEGVADEIALGAAACLLHHELGHIALGHKGGSEIQSEKDADLYAWEWIIGDRHDFDANDLSKRLLLLVHAYSTGIISDVHRGRTTAISHPRSIDRLFHLLKHFEVPENHKAYAYAFATLHLHLESTNNRLPVQEAAYESFFESFDELINHISAFPTIYQQCVGAGDLGFDDTVAALQSRLALVDQLTSRSSGGSGAIEFLVLKMRYLKIKMYQEMGHGRPHVHIDYGIQNHAASYAIDTAQRVEGNLPLKYDKEVTAWITKNQKALNDLWESAQAGEPIEELVLAIRNA